MDALHGGAGAFAGLTRAATTDRRAEVNGWATVRGVEFAGGLLRRDNGAPASARRSDLWFAGAAIPLGPRLTLDVEGLRLRRAGHADGATLLAGRATWSFSRRSALYASLGHVDNDGASAQSVSAGAADAAPRPGGAQSGVAAGLRHAF